MKSQAHKLQLLRQFNKPSPKLAQGAQRSSGCPIPGDMQGQTGPGSEQSDLAVDVLVHCKGVELNNV